MMGMLNSLDQFFVPALSPAMFNVASIACALFLVPLMAPIGQPPITAMVIGALVGGIGQVAIQWWALRKLGYRYRVRLDASDPGLRRVLVLMGPGTIGLAAAQVNIFVNTILATSEGTGAVSWLNYAFRLMYLPLGIFGVSLATAAVPAISRHAARNDGDGVRHEVANSLAMMLLLNVPATFGLLVLARPIVSMLFERGAFTSHDTDGDSGGAGLLRARPRRLFVREACRADLLRAPRWPDARRRQRGQRCLQHGDQFAPRPALRVSGPGRRHFGDLGAARGSAAGAVAAAPPGNRELRGWRACSCG